MSCGNGVFRRAEVRRTTTETDVGVRLDLDGTGIATVTTGLGFLDHMLISLARHARFDLDLECKGDLQVDDHHTVEDCALVLGRALLDSRGDGAGIARFGEARVPMDDALAVAAVDLGGRPFAQVDLDLRRDRLGEVACENLTHFMGSLAQAGAFNLHLDVLRGVNDHHKAEAAFKALAVALRRALRRDGGDTVPSTKGVL
ncbi:imidazoleglycerol-phosphate dehydratase HisB [bacterium]|nr:imidazoleglycerol-phosphate dehydratase HisB [bacterium]